MKSQPPTRPRSVTVLMLPMSLLDSSRSFLDLPHTWDGEDRLTQMIRDADTPIYLDSGRSKPSSAREAQGP
jgi:hypothetical protein